MTTPQNILRPRPQSQEALDEQLYKLIVVANHQGLYDAADWVQDVMKRRSRHPRTTPL
jgi:hypothetical protein